MAGLFETKQKKVQREVRQQFGFIGVRPALNDSGEEKFGLIELAPEYGAALFAAPGRKALKSHYFTAALRLSGPQLNLFLNDERQERGFWLALAQSLPNDSPSQVLLRRRRAELGKHYQAMQQKVQTRLGDEEVAYFFLQDYLDNLIYPIEETGLTSDWVGIFVSGRSEEEVADRLALLMAALPCETIACTTAELSLLLLDYFAPRLAEEAEDAGETADMLFSHWLAEDAPQLFEDGANNGAVLSFWTLAAPPPHEEGSWTRPLLESQSLAANEFDLVVHLAPAPADAKLVEVLNKRLATLERDMNEERAMGHKKAIRELAEQRKEIEDRLQAICDGSDNYFEVGINLALRSTHEDEAIILSEETSFKKELVELGLAPRRIFGLDKIEQAFLSCAPLNLGFLPRNFVLSSLETGQFAQLAGEGLPEGTVNQTLVGLTAAGQPIYFDPANRAGESALFFLGNPGMSSVAPARALVQYLTAMRYMSGSTIFGFDPKGEWAKPVKQLGGNYIALGPERAPNYGWNPLLVPIDHLNNLSALGGWVSETACYLGNLLELNPLDIQNLNPLLLECAIEAVEQEISLSADLLCQKAQSGGYRYLAERLSEIKPGGKYCWLFATPTRVPRPADLTFVGFSPRALVELNIETRQYYLNRFFSTWVSQLALHRQPLNKQLVILDEAQQFLAQPDSANALLWLKQNSAALGVSLWTLSPRGDEWLTSNHGQRLLDTADWQAFFSQNGAGLAGIARRLALPQRTLKIIRDLEPGAALLRSADGGLTEMLPLPCNYINRLIPTQPIQLADPAKANETNTQVGPKRPNVPEPLPVSAIATPEKEKAVSKTEEIAQPEKPADLPEKEPVYIFASAKRGA